DLGKDIEVVLRSVRLDEWHRSPVLTVADDGIFRGFDPGEPLVNVVFVQLIADAGLAHVKKVSENNRGRRALERVHQSLIIVRICPALLDEVRQVRIGDCKRIDLLSKLVDKSNREVPSGSPNGMSKPIAFAAFRHSAATSAAIFDLGPGQRPSA